jgi:hypothetical protein
VKLWGNWVIQVAMGGWRLYNQSNPAISGLLPAFPASLTVTTGTYKNYD